MVTYLLGTKEFEKALEELILEKTEGVPFFTEQFIKSLTDLKIIEKEKRYIAYQKMPATDHPFNDSGCYHGQG